MPNEPEPILNGVAHVSWCVLLGKSMLEQPNRPTDRIIDEFQRGKL